MQAEAKNWSSEPEDTHEIDTDSDLLARYIQDRDPAVFTTLYQRCNARAVEFARRKYKALSEKEDLVAEAWIRILQNTSFDPSIGNFTSYFYRTIRNIAMDKLRKKGITTVSIDGPHSGFLAPTEQPSARVIDAEYAHHLLGKLKDKQRTAIELTIFHHVNSQQAAEMMNIEEPTVKYHIRQARIAMQKICKEELGDSAY